MYKTTIANNKINCANCRLEVFNDKYIEGKILNNFITINPYKPIPNSKIPNNAKGFFVLSAIFLNKKEPKANPIKKVVNIVETA